MRTGPDFAETHTLPDGTRVVLRHIRPGDAAELQRAFERLSPGSRYRRFFGGVAHLSEAALRYLTEVDGHDHVAIVAATESPDLKSEQGLGVARFVRLAEEPSVAEAAVTVVDDVQRHGLGRLLATTLALAALERGVTRFRAEVLADNAPMLALMRDLGASPLPAVPSGATASASADPRPDGTVLTYDIPLESVDSARGGLVDRLFHAAADSVGVLLRRLALPP